MATVLTQSEIDALLNSLTMGTDTGPVAEEDSSTKGVRNYDFKTANKFSKEQMRTLHTIYDNFASVLSNWMTGLLRTLCQIDVISVEEQLFGEFNNSIPLPAVIAVIDCMPLTGSLIMQMSASVVYGMISRLFGGIADYIDESKPFSEIDLAIVENVLPQYTRIMNNAWEKVALLNMKVDRIETSPQFTMITAANEPAAIITFNVRMDNVEDMMAVCIPHFLIQPLSKALSSMAWTLGRGNESNANARRRDPVVEEHLRDTQVTLRARLDQFQIPMRDVLSMKVGDVLLTKHRINQFVMLDVEQLPKFKAVLGVSEANRVVQIAEIVKERNSIE